MRGRRKKKNKGLFSPKYLTWTVVGACILLVVAGWTYSRSITDKPDVRPVATEAEVLQEVVIPESTQSEMIDYTGFTVSFNSDKHQLNYVVWELTGEETDGEVPRRNKFLTDYRVKGCASDADYRRSGYDRGHMAPAADMKWSQKAMEDCFYFTNICPQDKRLNSGAWGKLEAKCRQWAKKYGSLVIVCGPILTDEMPDAIGPDRVPVPQRFFKVVLARDANPPMAIGFIMNNGRVEGGMQQAAVTVDEVERVTGFDFFSALPDDIENKVESTCRFGKW